MQLPASPLHSAVEVAGPPPQQEPHLCCTIHSSLPLLLKGSGAGQVCIYIHICFCSCFIDLGLSDYSFACLYDNLLHKTRYLV